MTTILRLPGVKERTGLSRSAIYDRINPKSKRHDPTFPKPISLGVRAVGWVESEIDAWLATRIDASRFDGNQSLALDREIVRREAGPDDDR